MKLSITACLSFWMLSTLSTAQPTITSNWMVAPGEVITFAESSIIPDVTATGENVTWDFSEVIERHGTLRTGKYIQVSDAPHHLQFPDANTCSIERYTIPLLYQVDEYNYSIASESDWQLLGSRLEAWEGSTAITMDYDDPKTIIEFPFTYGSEFSDNYSVQGVDLFDIQRVISGSVHRISDAYGTVILPQDEIPNCLRISSRETQQDSFIYVGGAYTFLDKDIAEFLWYRQGRLAPVARYEMITTTRISNVVSGEPDTTESSETRFWFDPMIVSDISDIGDNQPSLKVFPNPFTHEVTMNTFMDISEDTYFNVFGVNGQLVFSERLQGMTGLTTIQIDLSNLPSGHYIGVLQNKDHTASVKLIKSE